MAAALALGASGAVLGTVLVATEESMFPAAWKVSQKLHIPLLLVTLHHKSPVLWLLVLCLSTDSMQYPLGGHSEWKGITLRPCLLLMAGAPMVYRDL